jgi:hypothetical protein
MAEDDKRVPDGPSEQRTEEEDILGPYWAAMRRLRGADTPPEPTPEERTARTHPGEMVIATARGPLVRIQPDGRVIYGEGYTPDETAVTLWEAIGRRRPDFEARINYLNMLELHVALLYVCDEAYEAAQRARVQDPTEHNRQREELSRASLEMRVHGVIEFAREFGTLRPDLIAMARRTRPGGGGGPQGEPGGGNPT